VNEARLDQRCHDSFVIVAVLEVVLSDLFQIQFDAPWCLILLPALSIVQHVCYLKMNQVSMLIALDLPCIVDQSSQREFRL
jgi:hypothetical protein